MFRSLVLCIGLVLSAAATFGSPHQANKDSKNNKPVLEILARPPHHIRPYVSSSPTGYSVKQIRHAYGFDQVAATGEGQIIAIVDAYGSPTLQSDLDTFCAAQGIPSTTLQIHYPQGQPTSGDSNWALETALDVQWAHAVAPGATIVVVVARTASFTNLLAGVDYAVNLGAKQISMSWGAGEFSGQGSYEFHFNKPGVSFFAASGDNGSGVMWPAASSYVTSVGGTSTVLDANGNVVAETGWSGSGGGASAYSTRPAWQNGWQTYTGRGVPDVSYNADPNTGYSVYISNYNGATGWMQVGGTSAGAPQWAALAALVNATQTTPLGNWNSVLYAKAGNDYAYYYGDVQAGSNGGYNALASYDFVTGLGRPVANHFLPATPLVTTVTVQNSGFETPDVGGNTYSAFAYNPAASSTQGWTFEGNSGVTGNNTGFTAGNPAAPEGKQVAFIQTENSRVSQTLSFGAAGNYTLTLQAALRGNWSQGIQTVQVYLDGNLIGSITPAGYNYQGVSIGFAASAGSHTLSFQGTTANDSTAFIDAVAIASSP